MNIEHNYKCLIEILETIQNFTRKQFFYKSYMYSIYMYNQDLALNNL